MTSAPEKLLTVSEAARRAGVARNTIRAWADRALIAHVELPNGVYRIPESEVDRLLAVQPARTEASA